VTLAVRSAPERRLTRNIPSLTFTGVLVTVLALVLFLVPKTSPGLDFLGIFMVFAGASLLVPGITLAWVKGLSFLTRRRPGSTATLALSSIARSLSRTGLFIASLMVVIAVYIGVGTMTASFRTSVGTWVDGNIGGDVHLAPADRRVPGLDQGLVDEIAALPGVTGVSAYTVRRIATRTGGEVTLFAYRSDLSRRTWVWTAAGEAEAHRLLDQGWVWVSEIFAARNGIRSAGGASVTLDTGRGRQTFPVAGIFRDYVMGGGRIIVSPESMEQFWGVSLVTAMQLFLDGSGRVEEVMTRVSALGSGKGTPLLVRDGKALKRQILQVFDQTFAITAALQILTALVALAGIVNAILALLLERRHWIGILRACGAEVGQVTGLLVLESGICGWIAGTAALPLGLFLSWVLIHVVNRSAFGWTYELAMQPSILAQGVFMGVAAAVAAGFLPARRAGRFSIVRALRAE
jgi:putative ABC transport system permease protein